MKLFSPFLLAMACVLSIPALTTSAHENQAEIANPPNALALVELRQINPRIVQDMRYATANNFTKHVVYSFQGCWLRPMVAERLSRVQQELESQQLGLKVWDCFRPMAAQKRFWELVPDPRYVSPPGRGGLHTRGTAIDLTLVDAEGNEMVMPTAFDDFSPRAGRDYAATPAQARLNSQILQRVMEKHGFKGLDSEWWHFDLIHWKDYPPLIDLDPNVLRLPPNPAAPRPGS